VTAKQGLATGAVATDRPGRLAQRRYSVATAVFWLLGSMVVVLAQPGSDRSIAAAGAAVAGIVAILAVNRLTQDRERRYVRSIVAAMVAVSVVGDVIVQHLITGANGFVAYGIETRIALPLIFVLLVPLVLHSLPPRVRPHALWRDRAHIMRQARPLDWLALAYALLIVPDLLLGLAHHAPKSFIGQDLGLIVFFVFAYLAGRTVSASAGRASAGEIVALLVLLGAAQAILGFDTTPIFTYAEAACAAAVGFALFRPNRAGLLLLCVALGVLANEAIAIKNGTGSTTAVELAAALGVVAYLVVRARHLLPQWAIVGVAVAALAVFLAFTADGVTVRGQYHGLDQSQLGRAYEAHQVRAEIHRSPVSFVFGRGLGGSINETKAPSLFADSLVYGGRDLAHVQEVHLLPYEFLLKNGVLGFAWLVALVVGVAILGIRALEKASRERDPSPVLYAALPLLGIAAALAAATHLQDNPLNAFAVGVLVTRFPDRPSSRLHLGRTVAAAAVVGLAVGVIAFAGHVPRFVFSEFAGEPGGANAALVGGLRFNYPLSFKGRYFSTTNHAITATHHVRVHGVVVANYRLKRNPELHGSGVRFPADGVFFELYEAPRRKDHVAPVRGFPLTIFDLPDIPGLPAAREQGATSFSANGRSYRVILWVGPQAPKAAQLAAEQIVTTIHIR
jgi:hypothetical protein